MLCGSSRCRLGLLTVAILFASSSCHGDHGEEKSPALAAALTTETVPAAENCDCQALPLTPGPSVCGEDGIDYINVCFAECQGVTVASVGLCGEPRTCR